MVLKFITDFLLWFILLTSIWIIIHLVFKNNEGFQNINKWDFKEIAGIKLNQLCVSPNSQYIWGINTNNKIVFRNGIAGDWKNVSGTLTQITVSNDGKHVWAINKNDNIYYRPGYKGSWKNITGKLNFIVVSGDAQHIWGVNRQYQVFYRNGLYGKWKPISNIPLKIITISNNGNYVYGIGTDSLLYKLNNKKFIKIQGSTKKWKYISISGNGKILLGIQKRLDPNKNNVYYTHLQDNPHIQSNIQPDIIKGDCLIKVVQSNKKNIPTDKWFPDDKYGGPNKLLTIKECIERNYSTFCQEPNYKIETKHGDIIKLINPNEANRTYSSILNNDPIGTGNARSMLDSKQSWTAKNDKDGEWLQINLISKQHVLGIVTDSPNNSNQHITNFSIQYSLDNKNFKKIDKKFYTENKLKVHYLDKSILARYLRIIIHKWENHISLRTAVIIKNKPDIINLEWKILGNKPFKQLSLNHDGTTIWGIDNKRIVYYIEKDKKDRVEREDKEDRVDLKEPMIDKKVKYIRLASDCAGNNIATHLNTNIEECEQKCNANSKCLGFSYLNKTCITKSKDCPLPPYKYNNKYTTKDNSNNIWGQVKPGKNSSDDKVQYLGKFKSDKKCQEYLDTRNDITSYTWFNDQKGDYAKQCYGRTDGIWEPKTQKNITSAKKTKSNNTFKKIDKGKAGSNSACNKGKCIYDDKYCVNKYGQCGILESKVSEICGKWDKCQGVVCRADYNGYCLARSNMDSNSHSDMWGYKKKPDEWSFYKKNPDTSHCNWKCYLERYPDLSKAIGKNNIQGAKDHYINFGKNEGRDCSCKTEGLSPCIGKSHTNCLNEKNTCNWDVSNEKCYPIDCTHRREGDCEKTNNCEWNFAQNACQPKCKVSSDNKQNNLCGCDTIAIARRNFKDSETQWSKNYLTLTKPFPDDTYHCVINPNTGQSLEPSDSDQCEANPQCKFIKGANGINMCIQKKQPETTCEEEEQQIESSWLKNYCVKPPYQLLGQTENKKDCEALCKANHVEACSYQCNGCYGGPDIQPSLNNNLNCFQYAKHINHSSPVSETPDLIPHTITPQNYNPDVKSNDTNQIINDVKDYLSCDNADNSNIPTRDNSNIPTRDNSNIPTRDNNNIPTRDNSNIPTRDNSESEMVSKDCTSFIGYQQNGLSMTDF